jgi:benzoate 4-monooxygenase
LQSRRTQRSQSVEEQHRKYGDFVRIAPNHVSIHHPTALVEVYGHKTGFTKGPFYDAFFQVRPVIFTARDVSIHQKKRKYLNPAFSSRALLDFESIMDIDILSLKHHFDQLVSTGPAEMDFSIWGA